MSHIFIIFNLAINYFNLSWCFINLIMINFIILFIIDVVSLEIHLGAIVVMPCP